MKQCEIMKQNSSFLQKSVSMLSVPMLVIVCLMTVGCGAESPASRAAIHGIKADHLVPVRGRVVIDGKGVPDVWVRLAKKGEPALRKKAPAATTDSEGKFVFSTNLNGDGIAPGDYVISLEWLNQTGVSSWSQKDRLLNNYNHPQANATDPRFVFSAKDQAVELPVIEISTQGLAEYEAPTFRGDRPGRPGPG